MLVQFLLMFKLAYCLSVKPYRAADEAVSDWLNEGFLVSIHLL